MLRTPVQKVRLNNRTVMLFIQFSGISHDLNTTFEVTVEYVRIVVGEERGRSSYVICFFNSLFFNLYVKENNKKARITGSGPQSTEISFRQASRNMFRFSVNTRINVSASPPLVFCSRTKSLKQPLNYASFPLDNEVLSPRENAPVA